VAGGLVWTLRYVTEPRYFYRSMREELGGTVNKHAEAAVREAVHAAEKIPLTAVDVLGSGGCAVVHSVSNPEVCA